MFPADLLEEAEALLGACRARGLRLATAESCSGGLVAGLLTEIPGASDVVACGFVVYADAAKTALLGVPAELIRQHGAVSEPIARAMAEGALARSSADLTVAVTGIAGPGGATPAKPVGLVYIAAARRSATPAVRRFVFGGDRTAVRLAAVTEALRLLGKAVAA